MSLNVDNGNDFLDRTGIRRIYGSRTGRFVPSDIAVKHYPVTWAELPMWMRREIRRYGATDGHATADWPLPEDEE
jgi:hypothetical protein